MGRGQIMKTEKDAEDTTNDILFYCGVHLIILTMSQTDPCMVETATIDKQPMNIFDFGYFKDIHPEDAPPCGCGYRAWLSYENVPIGILQKYKLLVPEFYSIQKALERKLTRGYCWTCDSSKAHGHKKSSVPIIWEYLK